MNAALTPAGSGATPIRSMTWNATNNVPKREGLVAKATTFGRAIADARRAKGISQKELAAQIEKDEGGPISPTYLNDIEHDRRSPTSDTLIRRFARILGEEEDYLFVLAGKIPDDIRRKAVDRDAVVEG